MVLIILEQWQEGIVQQLSKLYERKNLTDVVIHVGKHKFEAHGFVIALFSTFFQELLETARQDNCELPICITFTDLSFEAISSLISFMYFGKMTVKDELIPEVLYLIKLLKVKGLEDLLDFFGKSQSTPCEISSLFEHFDNVYTFDVNLHEQVDIREILANKKFKAEIIPLEPWNTKHLKEDVPASLLKDVPASLLKVVPASLLKAAGKIPSSAEGATPSRSETPSEGETNENQGELPDSKSNRKRRSLSSHRRREKLASRLAKKRKKDDGEIPKMKAIKKQLLQEADKFHSKDLRDGSWPLSFLGIDILNKTSESVGARLINKGSKLIDNRKNPIKMAKSRFQREMSFFWHELCRLPTKQRKQFLSSLSDGLIKEAYKGIWKGKTIVDIMRELKLSTKEVTCCFFLLLVSGHLPLKTASGAYAVEDTYALYEGRIDKAISLYQTTDLFLSDIADQCWVPYAAVKKRIEELNIKKTDGFDKAIQHALLLCSQGLPLDAVLKTGVNEQYCKDFKRILDHHAGREIALPLTDYEERIRLALEAAWEKKSMTMMEAAQEFIVSYSTLCKRALALEDKESAYFPKDKRKRSIYRGKSEPVVRANVNRRGQKSKTDRVIRAALLSCKEGMNPEEAFKLYNIQCQRTRNIIRYNITRKDAPLDKSYTTRFKNAIDDVNINKKSVNEASKLHLINYSALREWFCIKTQNRRISKASAKIRRKPRFEDQIEAAIQSVQSGMSPAEAFIHHGMKDRKNLSILKYNADREDAPLHISYETRLNMAVRAVRNLEMSCFDAGREYCVNSSTLRYYEREGQRVRSKGNCSFDDLVKGVVAACRAGMSLADAFKKFNIKTPRYRSIIKSTLHRSDAPLEDPYESRLQKAKEAVIGAKMTLSEAADAFIVSPAVLNKYFSEAKMKNCIQKPSTNESCGSKFDAPMIAAIKSCQQGATIEEAAKEHQLLSERSLECLRHNANRPDAPIHVPYADRLDSAVAAVARGDMKISPAWKHFIVSPFTLENKCKKLWPALFQQQNSSDGAKESGSITVIPVQGSFEETSPVEHIPHLVQVIKQELVDDIGGDVEVYDTDNKTTFHASPDAAAKKKVRDATKTAPETGTNTRKGKTIAIQILSRYSKNNAPETSCIGSNNSTSNNKNTVTNSVVMNSNIVVLDADIQPDPNRQKPSAEGKPPAPRTAYHQRLQLALEACMTQKLGRAESARRYQVNLEELGNECEAELENKSEQTSKV